VSIVVILLGGAGLTGYFYGLKQANRPTDETDFGLTSDHHEGAGSKPETAGTEAPVTFYSALTEPRKEEPSVISPKAAEKTRTPLEVKPTGPPVTTLPIRDPGSGSDSAILQVASYKDQVNARKLLQELSSDGYAGTVVRADLGERGVWYRVRIGPYSQGEETERILKELRDDRKLKGFIVK
jgi:cell division septation protein DedD